MPYTIQNLIMDVLPRIARPGGAPANGITVWMAANSVMSMVYKHLLDRKSDLLATGELFLIIPGYDYMAPVPTGFISMAEKPAAVEASDWLQATAWMAGTVTSYTALTKTLIMNVSTINGSGTVADWHLAIGYLPGQPVFTVDTSVSSVLVGTGSKTFVLETGYDLVPGQNVILSNEEIPTDNVTHSRIDPEYLNVDDHEDYLWWEEYKLFGETWETATSRPRSYKVVGSKFYVRPKVTGPCMITGKYNAKPSPFVEGTYITEVPWSGFFDEIFREGIVRIVTKGVAIPDIDADFMTFFNREFGTIINSRASMIPVTGRTKRGTFM